MKRALLVAGLLLVLAAGWLLHQVMVGYAIARNEFTPVPASPLLAAPAIEGLPTLQGVDFTARSGHRMAGWYVPSRNGAVVIVTHGSNADRSTMLPEIRILADAGFGVLAFDWPGLGRSEGSIRWGHEEQLALRGAIDWVEARPDVSPSRIGVLGFSCGGMIVAEVASFDARLHAVVLEAAPPDFMEYILALRGEWRWLSRYPVRLALDRSGFEFDNLSPLRAVAGMGSRPLMVVSGSKDDVVPPAMERQLYDAAVDPREWLLVAGAGHGGYALAQPEAYGNALRGFFRKYLLEGGAGDHPM